jgi:hypothetical protein
VLTTRSQQLGVGVVRPDLPLLERAKNATDDPQPIAPEKAKQDESRCQMRQDEKGDEFIARSVDRPTEQSGDQDRMTQARYREELGEALQESQRDRLEERDHDEV